MRAVDPCFGGQERTVMNVDRKCTLHRRSQRFFGSRNVADDMRNDDRALRCACRRNDSGRSGTMKALPDRFGDFANFHSFLTGCRSPDRRHGSALHLFEDRSLSQARTKVCAFIPDVQDRSYILFFAREHSRHPCIGGEWKTGSPAEMIERTSAICKLPLEAQSSGSNYHAEHWLCPCCWI
jgi:hypothetical protein